jgi:hypothetical protein
LVAARSHLAASNTDRLKNLRGNGQIFVGHGFKPCRKVRNINAALAAGLLEFEMPNRL